LEAPQEDMRKDNGIIYWHRELPPFDAEAMGEHVVEAESERVRGTVAHRDEWWDRCYEDLMTQVRIRLEQEVARLGGNYAHVLNESVVPRSIPVLKPWMTHCSDAITFRRIRLELPH
jgi:hypothetical protein